MDSIVVGMGINVHSASVPPQEFLQFPATSFEDELGKETLSREQILYNIINAFISWRERMGSDELIKVWEESLAFRGEQVQLQTGTETPLTGELLGLEPDGSLRLRDEHDKSIIIRFGDISLRPAA